MKNALLLAAATLPVVSMAARQRPIIIYIFTDQQTASAMSCS